MKSLRKLSCLLVAGALLSCAFVGQALAAELYVSGAASLTNAFDEAKAAFEESFKVPCTGCNYCMPCSQGISIPSLFAAYNESFSLGWGTGFFHYMMSVGVTSGAPRLATSCIECGACVKKCPQHIDVPARMADVAGRLQPPGVKTALKLANPILSRW